MTALEKYYNKFNEDKRLKSRHGRVEFTTNMKYIHDFAKGLNANVKELSVLDIGAGTGAYSVPLSQEGFCVTAVELVKRNLDCLEAKHANVNCWPGNALDLSFLKDRTFDIVLLFGPLYHLHSKEERLKAFEQAALHTKKGGFIFASYLTNEYSIIEYCFKKGKILECLVQGLVTEDFHTVESQDQLYSYFRLEDITSLAKEAGLESVKLFASDGPADYMRQTLNAMSEEEFDIFLKYHLATCERAELLGASSHIVNILKI